MTNPTQPLTAEKITAICYDIAMPWTIYTKDRRKLAGKIENTVYQLASQQNVELVTNCEKLKSDKERLNDLLETKEAAITAWMKVVKEWEAENERLKQQLAWQPIESAPKDGTLVWISGPKYNNRSLGAYLTDKYIEDNNIYNSNDDKLIEGWYEYETGHPEYDEYWQAVCEPILWQPVPELPTPPKEAM